MGNDEIQNTTLCMRLYLLFLAPFIFLFICPFSRQPTAFKSLFILKSRHFLPFFCFLGENSFSQFAVALRLSYFISHRNNVLFLPITRKNFALEANVGDIHAFAVAPDRDCCFSPTDEGKICGHT